MKRGRNGRPILGIAQGRLYSTARWQRLREQQLRAEPICKFCWEREKRTTPASVCDHVEPHKGDETRFWTGPFQSLCSTCHNSDKQRIERGGKPKQRIAADGWPL